MNFTCKLADFQDMLIKDYKNGKKTITDDQMTKLQNNIWIALAEKLAPNNLVIRQYCLIDIFRKEMGLPLNNFHKINILRLLEKLTYNNNELWAEGYSYWLYTKDALCIWNDVFNHADIAEFINKIDKNFIITSYKRDSLWYPIPFGDLRDIPLAQQQDHEVKNVIIGSASMQRVDNKTVYRMIAKPIGFNTHIPKKDIEITVTDNYKPDFKFYDGYKNKYKNIVDEMIDTFDVKRIASIFFL